MPVDVDVIHRGSTTIRTTRRTRSSSRRSRSVRRTRKTSRRRGGKSKYRSAAWMKKIRGMRKR
jgi:hypothetical protein